MMDAGIPPVEAPEDIINRILPASLHQYFFFDGERIDGFFRHDRDSHIAEDTKELLGVKVLDRGIEHLKKAKRSLQEELEELGRCGNQTATSTANRFRTEFRRD